MSVWRAREEKEAATYGSARWATEREVRTAGLLGPNGVVIGRLGGADLRHNRPEHVLCFAPTRSGKGVGLVVPTPLTWPVSTIVHDIKGENFRLTAGWRATFGRVHVFEPTNAASVAYNPLLKVRRGDAEVRDVTLGKDANRIRVNPTIMARLRSFALNIARANGATNIGATLWNALSTLPSPSHMPVCKER